jgi:hypothetical protein
MSGASRKNSRLPKPPKTEAQEFFYLEDGQKADADLHEFILDQGDDEAARAVSAKVAARILSPKRLAKLNGETKAFNPSEPRDELILEAKPKPQ